MLKMLMKIKSLEFIKKIIFSLNLAKGEGGTLCIVYREPMNQQTNVSQFQTKETITNNTYPRAACSQTGGTIAAQRW